MNASVRPPSINGWAPWVAVVVAAIVPTAAWLISMGQAQEQQQATMNAAQSNARKLERISEKVSDVSRDIAVIKVKVERLEVDGQRRERQSESRKNERRQR